MTKIYNMCINSRQTESEELETKKQRYRRYLSIAIVIFSMLVSSIGKCYYSTVMCIPILVYCEFLLGYNTV